MRIKDINSHICVLFELIIAYSLIRTPCSSSERTLLEEISFIKSKLFQWNMVYKRMQNRWRCATTPIELVLQTPSIIIIGSTIMMPNLEH
jgi:hypothetical protein